MIMPGDASHSRRRRRSVGVESSSSTTIGEGGGEGRDQNINEGEGFSLSHNITEIPSPPAEDKSFAASGGGGSSATLLPPRSYYNFDPMAIAYESGVGDGRRSVDETSIAPRGSSVGESLGQQQQQQQQQQRRPTSPLELTVDSRRWQQSPRETKSFVSPTARIDTTTTRMTTGKKYENDENDRSTENRTTPLTITNDDDDNTENHIFRNNNYNSSGNQQPQPPKLSDFLINDICYQRYLLEGRRPARYRGLGGSTTGARRNNRKRGYEAGDGSSSSIMDSTIIANVCAIYCFIAMIFLIFVAIIIETQPIFLKGVSVKSSSSSNMLYSSSSSSTNNRFGSDIEYDPTYDNYYYSFRKETSNALKASAAYFVIMVLCYIYLQAKDMNYFEVPFPLLANISGRICHTKRVIVSSIYLYRRRHYDDIPDHDSYDDLPPSSSSSSKLVVRRGEEGGRRNTMTSSVLPTHHHHHHNSSNGYGESGMLKSRGVRKKVVGDNNNNNHVSGKSSSSSSSPWSTTSLGIGMGAVSPPLPPTTATTISSSSSVVGDAIENVWIKVKSWGSGGEGSSRNGRKKDR